MNAFSRLTPSMGLKALACGLLTGLSLAAAAVDYPERPVQMVVSVQAGGSTDSAARLIAQKLSERLVQPFLVENKTGAATRIGTEYVMKAKPDGYTRVPTMKRFRTVTAATHRRPTWRRWCYSSLSA